MWFIFDKARVVPPSSVDPEKGEWMYELKDHKTGVSWEGMVAESHLELAKSTKEKVAN